MDDVGAFLEKLKSNKDFISMEDMNILFRSIASMSFYKDRLEGKLNKINGLLNLSKDIIEEEHKKYYKSRIRNHGVNE